MERKVEWFLDLERVGRQVIFWDSLLVGERK